MMREVWRKAGGGVERAPADGGGGSETGVPVSAQPLIGIRSGKLSVFLYKMVTVGTLAITTASNNY